ncbi:Alcohol dehydrogenase 7 [Spatholobus suberectus]|nr:Alcohol dehydrogenase 7 [Spatholobus suberectus]
MGQRDIVQTRNLQTFLWQEFCLFIQLDHRSELRYLALLDTVVESVGEDVTEFTKGDVVVPIFLPDCGECIDCKSSKSNLCSEFPFQVSPWMPRHGTSRFTDLKGEIIHHFLSVSSFSEYTVVDVANLTKIDPTIPPNRACLLSCGVSTGVGAAWRTAGVEPGSTVAIFGLGSIGLAVRNPHSCVFFQYCVVYYIETLIASDWFPRLLRELDFVEQLGL